MPSIFVVEVLEKKGKAWSKPLFAYNLSNEPRTCTDLAKVLAFDGCERFEEQAITDAKDIAKEMDRPTRVRKLKISFEPYVQLDKKISLDKPLSVATVSE